MSRIDHHTRELCGKPDMSKYGKAQENLNLPLAAAEDDPPNCRCCGQQMRVVSDCLSTSFQQLGMYEVVCSFCS